MGLSDDAVVVNVQGDEPLIDPALIAATAALVNLQTPMATAAHAIHTVQDLFNPNVGNIAFLLCKQIVRDHSEFTNHRGCRIMAEPAAKGINILIMLPKKK